MMTKFLSFLFVQAFPGDAGRWVDRIVFTAGAYGLTHYLGL